MHWQQKADKRLTKLQQVFNGMMNPNDFRNIAGVGMDAVDEDLR